MPPGSISVWPVSLAILVLFDLLLLGILYARRRRGLALRFAAWACLSNTVLGAIALFTLGPNLWLAGGVIAAAVIFTLGAVLLFQHSVARPLERLAHTTPARSNAGLPASGNELDDLAARLQETQASLDDLDTRAARLAEDRQQTGLALQDAAAQGSGVSTELAATMEQLQTTTLQAQAAFQQVAENRSQQALTVQDVTATLAQIAAAVSKAAANSQAQVEGAGRAAKLAAQIAKASQSVLTDARASEKDAEAAVNTAASGAGAVSQTLNNMQAIFTETADLAVKIQAVGQRSEEISEIIATIGEIAEQTNLVALNAAIEAARADSQSQLLIDQLLNRLMSTQARLLAQLLVIRPGLSFEELCEITRQVDIETAYITDGDGVTVLSNEAAGIGFRFSDDPKQQTFEFRQLIHQKDGMVGQKAQPRSIDKKIYKYVGVSRIDQPGIVQVGLHDKSIAQFGLQASGFAVVAEEVRRLAERAGKASKEIGRLITTIQHSVQETVDAMQASRAEVESGTANAGQSVQALQAILAAIQPFQAQSQQVARTAQEMEQVAKELSRALESLYAAADRGCTAAEGSTGSIRQAYRDLESAARADGTGREAVESLGVSLEKLQPALKTLHGSGQALAQLVEELDALIKTEM